MDVQIVSDVVGNTHIMNILSVIFVVIFPTMHLILNKITLVWTSAEIAMKKKGENEGS